MSCSVVYITLYISKVALGQKLETIYDDEIFVLSLGSLESEAEKFVRQPNGNRKGTITTERGAYIGDNKFRNCEIITSAIHYDSS